jgi:hypothetical protein
MKYTFQQILDVLDRKKYTFYSSGNFNLNLIGVRAENSVSDSFDDKLYCLYRGSDNRFKIHEFAITTDPGKHWLLNPMNIKGCAILIPGQYKSVYKIGGRHKDYEALEQCAPMAYVRDNDKNNVLNFELYRDPELRKENLFWDNIKSNIHRSSPTGISNIVNRWSAACQVLQSKADFDTLIALAHKNRENGHGDKLSYCLLEDKDFL